MNDERSGMRETKGGYPVPDAEEDAAAVQPKIQNRRPKTPARPRVLFINRSYWPDTEATGQLLTDLCEDLSADFQITVVAGLPNHLQPGAEMPRSGYDRHGTVTVLRIPHTRFAKHSFAGRIANLASFTLSAFCRTLFISRPDLVVTETDPFLLPLLGRWLKWRYRCRFVAYLQDVYPDIAVAVGKVKEGGVTGPLRKLLVGAYCRADRVVVLSRCMAERCARNGVPADRLDVIPNWVDTDSLQPVRQGNEFRSKQQLAGKFTVMYSGNLGVGHLLRPVLEAADQLRDVKDICFLFVGEGAQKEELKAWCTERNLTSVRFLPYQPREFLSHSLSAADVQIVSLRPEVVGCLMPSKLYGVLAAGTAVLAVCPDESELAEVVREADVGLVCSTSSSHLASEIAAAILKMKSDPEQTRQRGERARELAVQHYDQKQCTSRFQRMLSEVLNN